MAETTEGAVVLCNTTAADAKRVAELGNARPLRMNMCEPLEHECCAPFAFQRTCTHYRERSEGVICHFYELGACGNEEAQAAADAEVQTNG